MKHPYIFGSRKTPSASKITRNRASIAAICLGRCDPSTAGATTATALTTDVHALLVSRFGFLQVSEFTLERVNENEETGVFVVRPIAGRTHFALANSTIKPPPLPWVVRVHPRWSRGDRPRNDAAVLRLLGLQRYPAPRVIAALDHAPVTTIGAAPDERTVLVTTYCDYLYGRRANRAFAPRVARARRDTRPGAKDAVRRGFTMFKWTPFRGDALRAGEHATIARAAELMAAAREAAGDDVDIAIECAEYFTHRTAMLAARALAPSRPFWFEEPLPFENPKAMALLKHEMAGAGVPLATGERLCSKWEFRELIELGGADVLQPDLIHAGGITEVKKIAALADTYYVPIAPHNSSGPIANLLSVHLAASIPNFLVLEEIEPETEIRDSICTHPLKLDGGYFPLPVEPGIGTDLKLDVLEAHAEEHRFRPQPPSNRTEPPRY